MSKLNPVPPEIVQHYGSVERFSAASPELYWNGPNQKFSLQRVVHKQLLAADS
jgi:hypothetical protein